MTNKKIYSEIETWLGKKEAYTWMREVLKEKKRNLQKGNQLPVSQKWEYCELRRSGKCKVNIIDTYEEMMTCGECEKFKDVRKL